MTTGYSRQHGSILGDILARCGLQADPQNRFEDLFPKSCFYMFSVFAWVPSWVLRFCLTSPKHASQWISETLGARDLHRCECFVCMVSFNGPASNLLTLADLQTSSGSSRNLTKPDHPDTGEDFI